MRKDNFRKMEVADGVVAMRMCRVKRNFVFKQETLEIFFKVEGKENMHSRALAGFSVGLRPLPL